MRLNFFFDIDGTLLPVGQDVPKSAIDAMYRAKEMGHRLFFCTGRNTFELTRSLNDLPFDGGVFAAGTKVVYDKKVVWSRYFSAEQRKLFFDIADRYNLMWINQSDDCTFLTAEALAFFNSQVEKVHHRQYDFNGFCTVDCFPEDKPFVKFFILSSEGRVLEARRELDRYFDTTNNVNGLMPECAAEGGLKGISKATGIERLLDFLGEDIRSSVGVGDGDNDIEMIEHCGYSIAMGNACQDLKDRADWVTTGVLNDGIANAIYHVIDKMGHR